MKGDEGDFISLHYLYNVAGQVVHTFDEERV